MLNVLNLFSFYSSTSLRSPLFGCSLKEGRRERESWNEINDNEDKNSLKLYKFFCNGFVCSLRIAIYTCVSLTHSLLSSDCMAFDLEKLQQ